MMPRKVIQRMRLSHNGITAQSQREGDRARIAAMADPMPFLSKGEARGSATALTCGTPRRHS